ncbi:hypothetical protein M9H77_11305 [Catharanthus roseus]|uniref:Uncharacterized protein n=1 Tax=Catharanthus roseus TaxID=4058 RepID=A0ACC0BE81_CATRO|nr:hypothetical protein M9H77_11305 [Catharanthus roseus]
MVRGSKKKRAHPETSTGPATTSTTLVLASVPEGMFASLTTTSTLPALTYIPPEASTPLATLTPFPQFSYSSLTPISTLSSSSSAMGMSSRPTHSSLACSAVPPVQGAIDSPILILPTAESFNKQSACTKSSTEIMKEHFVEAHASFGKISDRIKNLWYTEFGKRYR